jgi:hypothetical protein
MQNFEWKNKIFVPRTRELREMKKKIPKSNIMCDIVKLQNLFRMSLADLILPEPSVPSNA